MDIDRRQIHATGLGGKQKVAHAIDNIRVNGLGLLYRQAAQEGVHPIFNHFARGEKRLL